MVAYELAYGKGPFHAQNKPRLTRNILNGTYSFPYLIETSDDFKDFVSKLLVKDPSQRLGANGALEVLAHPWFGTGEEKATILNKEKPAPILPVKNGEICKQYYNVKNVKKVESHVPTENIHQDAFAGFGKRAPALK